MIKTYKHFITAALALLTLAACGSGDNEPDAVVRKECPDFTASICDPLSRAVDSQWESGDEIGISGEGRTNVCYRTVAGDGVFTVKTTDDQIYFQGDAETTFTASYPWCELADGTSAITADTRTQAQQKSFDFLWAQASGKRAQPTVAFNFAHRMAKVVLTLNPGYGVSLDELKAVLFSIEGLRHTGSFDIADGVAAADAASAADKWLISDNLAEAPNVTVNENSLTCTFIFFPQVLEAPLTFTADFLNFALMAKVDFTAANREKDGADARNEWVAGRQYNLSLTLHKTEITLDVCTINPWNEVWGDDISVD